MKNVSSLKTNKIDSPKTPGGISKSLLTPCRRVGLSRNWRKGGPSPFVSPIPGTADTKENVQAKRKTEDVNLENSNTENTDCELNITPTRNVDIPRRKKSKILAVDSEPLSPVSTKSDLQDKTSENITVENVFNEVKHNDNAEPVTPLLKTKSRSLKKKPQSPTETIQIQSSAVVNHIKETSEVTPMIKSKSKGENFISPLVTNKNEEADSCVKINTNSLSKIKQKKNSIKLEKNKTKSPENLTKECIVVIQNKLFKGQVSSTNKCEHEKIDQISTSQTLDSDSDDVPLCQLNKKENEVIENKEHNIPIKEKAPNLQIQHRVLALDEDDDFIGVSKLKVKNLDDKATSTTSLKKTVKNKPKEKKKPLTITTKEPQASSQSSEDDDFDFNQKRTILIRKSYDKVTKPLKAKSTGSITQKDIDELRSRIEVKKKLLLAQAMTKDTEELRDLIKKWQKGCQDALTELIELMRSKFPDKQHMQFSEILQTLKIPSKLVGYDEENDCFNTPDDASIILAKFNDL